ncbi:MAG TPA: bifunctional phosphoribosylaminoimidazolecarboxamide formyltransferase/IMP cyclohydrolase [Thermoanaerobaculia bacterium]|nr:bifunctional phosphoribosylaminoimidazolecarboxamide formyltransferase/IMP cyclohydrolase [Thermoanaerobaculia bacterium]
MRIERAILSVSDKRGIVELAKALRAKNVEILSTGGTAKHLAGAGVEVTPVAKWSGAPEILGGRVKTLTPRVFGAILHDRENREHLADIESLKIPPIDLVVVNLYPFERTIAREGVTVAEAIEQIDIGGPSMLRAAAKNHRYVLPLPDPSLYEEFLRELANGEISEDFRRRCAVAVFERTSQYDRTIATFLGGNRQPETLDLHVAKFQDLRYGENPQQTAAFYANGTPFEQLQGKELSYNNLLDLDSAMRLASAFREPAAVVIKHTNPCGVARRDTAGDALRAAIDADPVSAFGGIVSTNREFDERCAHAVDPLFMEVIVAPSFSPGAVETLKRKKNLRLIVANRWKNSEEFRSAAGGVLAQSVDRVSARESWKIVTRNSADSDVLEALEFAWIVCAHVKSNAIVLTGRSHSIGVGAGQMSRVDAAKVAIMKAKGPTTGSFAASDAFFPFRDGLDILADAGVRAVIQPGGSVRDAEVIAAADERGLTMVFTGERHFRH